MLRLMSLQRRRERYTIIQMWKTHNGAAPNSTNTRFYHHQRLGIRAEVPTLYSGAQKSFSTKYFHSFTVRAARLWNTLPKEVNTAVTLDTFKVLLGRWLDHFPDNPPVKGYSTRNSNSIMDWVLEVRAKGGCWKDWHRLRFCNEVYLSSLSSLSSNLKNCSLHFWVFLTIFE